ncbi:MAG: hypothetical protein FWG99_03755 [Treponema sp.]|nr:hypothetical protein [Treponema sp.]
MNKKRVANNEKQLSAVIGKRTGFLIALAALLAILAGCPNIMESPNERQYDMGEGFFILNLGRAGNARTILPVTQPENISRYTLIFNSDGKEEISVSRYESELDNAIRLPVGIWNLTVTAFVGWESPVPVATGNMAGITISSGGTTSRNIELRPIIEGGGMGTFKWKIDYPSEVTTASMTISPLDEEAEIPEQTLYFTGGTPWTWKESELELDTGYYRVVFSMSNGAHITGREEFLHIYQGMESYFEYTFTVDYFSVYSVVSSGDYGPGTLRYAIDNAAPNSTIYIESSVGTIYLGSRLEISKDLTILGNGTIMTPTWTTGYSDSQMMLIENGTVNIRRIHFKDARSSGEGRYIRNYGNLTLESCIISDNYNAGSTVTQLYSEGTLTLNSCTFFLSRSMLGVFIEQGSLYLTGNLFYGVNNTFCLPVINNNGTVVSGGYNLLSEALSEANKVLVIQAGLTTLDMTDTDKLISNTDLPFSPITLRLIGYEAWDFITTLPAGYPSIDFYGTPISNGAAAGAVQTDPIPVGYYLDLSVNDTERGSVSITPESEDFIFSGPITLTANAEPGYEFIHWSGSTSNPLHILGNDEQLSMTLSDHTFAGAIFGRPVIVNNLSDEAGSANIPGTLRHTVNNSISYDIIRITGVTPGSSVITLTSTLNIGAPSSMAIGKFLILEGNGVTLARSTSNFDDNIQSALISSNPNCIVKISRIHFKGGRANKFPAGGAIDNTSHLTLESCIFSDNRAAEVGGAINSSSWGSLILKGCTFYGNQVPVSGNMGGAIYWHNGNLTGNIFYGNTAPTYPVIHSYGSVSSNGRNVADVSIGTGSTQSGWAAGTGDRTFSSLGITGVPINTSTFKPLSSALNIVPLNLADFPTTDFYGNPRTGAAGAVNF